MALRLPSRTLHVHITKKQLDAVINQSHGRPFQLILAAGQEIFASEYVMAVSGHCRLFLARKKGQDLFGGLLCDIALFVFRETRGHI